MPIPDFVVALREKVGTAPLWLSGTTAVVLRDRGESGTGNGAGAGTGAGAGSVASAGGVAAGGDGSEREVLLVRRADNGEWTPVTGIVEPGEEPAVAAEREVLEEASIVAVAERLVWVRVSRPIQYENGDRAQYLDTVFACRYVSGEAAVGDDENVDVGWFALDGLPPMAADFVESVRLAASEEPTTRFQR